MLTEIEEHLRSRLRVRGFAPLERYRSESAEYLFMGYRRKLRNHRGFLDLARATKDVNLGTMTVRRMELAEHDWLNRMESRI